MLLTNGFDSSAAHLFREITICRLERAKNCHVTWLKLMGCLRGKATENDVVVTSKLLNFQRFVGHETVVDQDAWPAVSALLSLRIKNSAVLVKHNGSIRVAFGETGKVLFRRGVNSLIAALGCHKPDDEWRQTDTVSGKALDGAYQLAFDRCSSVFSCIVFV